MFLASDILMLLLIVLKNTDKIYEEFGLDLEYYFSTPYRVIDLILRISNEKISLITNIDKHFFVERSMRGGYLLHRDRVLKTSPVR